jgi:2-polyprenyl-6-methoxyphenol hydroxylase-like FAD-dependent oxidoreductase
MAAVNSSSDVLVVGAGPTGLVLALSLMQHGVRPRIIDKNSGPAQQSRAMAVHARTLEFYRQLGFAQEVVDAGIKVEQVRIRENNHDPEVFKFGDLGSGISPYPFVLSYPQDDHERLLNAKLAAAGLSVQWGVDLAHCEQSDGAVHATLLRADGSTEEGTYRYLCGCDGGHSRVREDLGIAFQGGTYAKRFFVADVRADCDTGVDLSFTIGPEDLCLVFPVRSSGMHRLIASVPESLVAKKDIAFADVGDHIQKLLGLEVTDVNWFSVYNVHHRIAERFRKGNVFLCGDAGHEHSPVGGQGMNTGIGDAFNLAWKLAGVLRGALSSEVLDTYETERIGFAQSLVHTTDRLFKLATDSHVAGRVFRETFFGHVAPFMLGIAPLRKELFSMVSQTKIHYPDSTLSRGAAGHIHGGDRLPWISDPSQDNFAPLASCDWQAHVFGAPAGDVAETLMQNGIALHVFELTDAARAAGFLAGALYLVRPDSYLSLVQSKADAKELGSYLGGIGKSQRLYTAHVSST